jgi:two-component system, OmpR family, sensor kinase
VGVVAHRAELVEEIARNAAEQGRRAAAEELVTVLAHDLRNHVSPIQLRLALVQRRSRREGRSEDARDIDIALRSVHRLAALITDILDVARIERGVFEVHPEVVDLVALARECAAALSPAESPIPIRAAEDVVVAADPRRVRQCLENLLSNAIRHAPQHGAVAVDVAREVRERGEWARVTVVDEGPGIAPEVLPRLFDRFVTGSQGGLGLGLYLAKRIAAAHGGDLTVESSPGKGARFSLTLPFPR